MILKEFSHFGGRHCETVSLKKVLDYNGAGYRGLSFSEEMLLGLGGGLGFIYWYMKRMPAPFIGTRYSSRHENFLVSICRRIGLKAEVMETGSAKKGYGELKAVLGAGQPAICYGDMAYLPYFAVPETAHFGGHAFVVFGLDEESDEVYISDRGMNPVTITIEELQRARGSKFPPFPARHRILKIKCPSKIEIESMKSSIETGIKDCCDSMLKSPVRNLGLAGIQKWADAVVKWPLQFKGLNLFGCLFNTFLYIETAGTGRSAFRTMYAKFLEEASSVVDKPALGEAAEMFGESGKVWSEIANAALPDDWPALRRTRELLIEKNRLFEAQQPGALERMNQINAELDNLMKQAAEELQDKNPAPLLASLRQKIMECYAIEQKAFQILRGL